MMQQLVGGADPSSPLDADWDADTASVTSTDYTDKAEEPAGTAASNIVFVPNLVPSSCLYCSCWIQSQVTQQSANMLQTYLFILVIEF